MSILKRKEHPTREAPNRRRRVRWASPVEEISVFTTVDPVVEEQNDVQQQTAAEDEERQLEYIRELLDTDTPGLQDSSDGQIRAYWEVLAFTARAILERVGEIEDEAKVEDMTDGDTDGDAGDEEDNMAPVVSPRQELGG